MADPPVYAPWLLFGICVIFLAWVFWRRDYPDEGPSSPEIRQTTHGRNSPNIGSITGNPTFNYAPPNPPAVQERKDPYGFRSPGEKRPTTKISPEDTRKPDTNLAQLISHIDHAIQSPPGVETEDEQVAWLELHLMDKASLEDLAIWARRGHSSLSRMHLLAAGCFTLDIRNGILTRHRSDQSPFFGDRYTDLHFSSVDMNKLWPTPPRTTNDSQK